MAEPWADGVVPGEIVYVGRASFRVAHEGDGIASPYGEPAVWLSPGPSSAPASERESDSAGEGSGPEMDVAPIAVDVGLSRRVPRWFKPSLWTVVIGPITAAFLLGMLVSPRRLPSPFRLATNPVMGRPSLVVQPKEPLEPAARVIAASAPIVAPLSLAPAFEVAPHHLAIAVEARTPAPAEPGTKLALKRVRSIKVHVPERNTNGKAAAGERSASVATDEAAIVPPSPARRHAVKPWVDPWAN